MEITLVSPSRYISFSIFFKGGVTPGNVLYNLSHNTFTTKGAKNLPNVTNPKKNATCLKPKL